MRRPVVVLVLLAILGLFACCAGGPKERIRMPPRPPSTMLNATISNFREVVQQHTGRGQIINFEQSHHSQHVPPNYPDMSNTQMINFEQSHHFQHVPHNYPDMSNTQSTNFNQHASSYDRNMSNTIQPKTNPKRSRLSTKPSFEISGFDGTPFLPNQSQSTAWTGSSTVVSPTPNPSNFTSGNPGSSKKGKSASKKEKSASKNGSGTDRFPEMWE
ncbi:hypothetical protein GPALN_005911 [Globodera pallida]|nr:hypothetical protein GPALN_005911 [Globodera pallida]